MIDILAKIVQVKRQEVAHAKAHRSLHDISMQIRDQVHPRGFQDAIGVHHRCRSYSIIAEIKRKSPSRGWIRPDLDPAKIAKVYEDAGAACLSVLTDKTFFGGSPADLIAARTATALPVLRKDFLLDLYQVYDSRAMGADCVLLILAIIDDRIARDLLAAAEEVGLDVLVEVHDAGELERALGLGAQMIGINNRDLRTFRTTLETTLRLAPDIPEDMIVVSESGIRTHADIAVLAQAGAKAFLVGEYLMREDDVGAALRRLRKGHEVGND